MYIEHFGFSKLPFSVSPDPQVFFGNSLYREALAKLQHGVLAKKGFVLITGEVGTGKTTLLRKLLHNLGPTVHSVFIFNTQVSFVNLLHLILDDLNLSQQSGDKLDMIEVLNQYLIERVKEGHIVTVLIDEAQNLCDEALEGLRLLSNLETDTEKLLQIVLMGQPELEIKLDRPKLRQLKQRITLKCRLAPLRNEEVGAYVDFRLNAAGYRGKNLFDRASVETIAFYSRGIPRLVNVICDNALRAAFAASKQKVSAQMVEEVAHHLGLGRPRPNEARQPVHYKMPENPPKSLVKEERLPEFENVFAGAERGYRTKLQARRSLTGLGVGVLLGAVFLGGIAVSYSEQSRIYVSGLATTWGDFSRDGKEFFAGLAARMGEAVQSQWKNLKQVKLNTEASDNQSSKVGWADSNAGNPRKQTEPLFGRPVRVAERPPSISQESKAPERKDKILLSEATKPAGAPIANTTGPSTGSRAIPDNAKVPGAESHPLPSEKPKAAQLEGPKTSEAPYLGNFQVVENSFVRDKPESDAAIVATLQPGALVRVESKAGKYFRVRSLSDPGVRGYVHEEDAFFRRNK